jgi:hypothetical protein
MTQWDKVELMRLLKLQVDAAIKTDRLKPNDAMKLLSDYERFLRVYISLSTARGHHRSQAVGCRWVDSCSRRPLGQRRSVPTASAPRFAECS